MRCHIILTGILAAVLSNDKAIAFEREPEQIGVKPDLKFNSNGKFKVMQLTDIHLCEYG